MTQVNPMTKKRVPPLQAEEWPQALEGATPYIRYGGNIYLSIWSKDLPTLQKQYIIYYKTKKIITPMDERVKAVLDASLDLATVRSHHIAAIHLYLSFSHNLAALVSLG